MKIDKNSIILLYRTKKITIDGVRKAVERKWITKNDFKEITGQDY